MAPLRPGLTIDESVQASDRTTPTVKERRSLRHWAGLWATLAAIAACATLTFATPTPLPIKGTLYAIPLAAIVYASYSAHQAPAIASATVGSIYAFIQYGALDLIFPSQSDRLLLGGAVALITFGMSFVAHRTRRAHDQLAERALRAEHALAADLSTKNAELQQTNAALTDANRALESFTYVVSHDLKEPARALAELTRALQEDHAPALDAEGKAIVQRSIDSSLRLQALLSGLIDYSRAARIQATELDAIRIEDVVAHAECRTRYESLLRDRQGSVAVVAGPAVRASMPGLCQVLGNLILNAIKHNPRPGAHVNIFSGSCIEDPGLVEVAVEDDGPGYPEVLIERFNRVSVARPATLHGGFGLIIAREATEKMGGRMRLDHAARGGARTVITLQAAQVQRERPQGVGPQVPIAVAVPSEG